MMITGRAELVMTIAVDAPDVNYLIDKTIQVAFSALPGGNWGAWTKAVFQLSGPVVPGQPISFTWEVISNNPPAAMEMVTATVLLRQDGVPQAKWPVVFTSPPVPLKPVGSWANTDAQPGTTVAAINLDTKVAMELYHIGTRALHLEVTSSVVGHGPYSDEDDLVVLPEKADDWWQWDDPTDDQLAKTQPWNRPYKVTGRLTNKSQWTSLSSLVVSFVEHNTSNGTDTLRDALKTYQTNLGSGIPTAVDSVDITQKWEWLIPAFWIQKPDQFLHLFRYQAVFQFNDAFANAYPPHTALPSLPVNVEVSLEKRAFATNAAVLLGGGIALTVLGVGALSNWFTGISAPIFFALATAAYGQAAASGALALDPPEPDTWRYTSLAKPTAPDLPLAASDADGVQGVREFFAETGTALAIYEALLATEARLEGAHVVGDALHAERQRGHYLELTQMLVNSAYKLVSAARSAGTEIDSHVHPDRLTQLFATRLANGLSSADREMLVTAGLPEDLLDKIDHFVRQPAAAEALSLLPQLLERSAHAMGMVAYEQKRRAPAVVRRDSMASAGHSKRPAPKGRQY